MVHKIAMKPINKEDERDLINSLSQDSGHQAILIDILKSAHAPHPLEVRIGLILDCLLALQHLNFSSKAALFLVDPYKKVLRLKVAKGFPGDTAIACNETRFDLCHCGQTSQKGTVQFFTSLPPQHDVYSELQPFQGNYCVPILKDTISLGVFTIYVDKNHRPSPEIKNLLEATATIFAAIIAKNEQDLQVTQKIAELQATIVDLQEESTFTESIFQGLNHGLLIADLDGKIIRSNSVSRSVFKPFSEQLDGQYLSEIVGHNAATQLLSSGPANSKQLDRELSLVAPNGENKIIGYSNVTSEDARGREIGVIISLADISELKYIRKEMEKMNRLSTVAEIASAVAHEVRNPLAGIKIMAQSIEEESGVNSEHLECSQRIIRQVDRLNVLLGDFFSYARPAEPNKRPTSLNAIIEETKHLINNRLVQNYIELHEEIGSKLPLIVADPHQVQQVFLNLFLNAIDAIKGQGCINISAKLLSKAQLQPYKNQYPGLLGNRPYVVVQFIDNGAGMSPETAAQVFEPFFTTKSSGAGLGLSIVYRTLKENDATIVLKSREGKGTTFTIFFRADV